MEFDYSDKNILNDAWAAVDRGDPFSICISGWKAMLLKKSIPMYLEYFYEKELRNEKKNRLEILKFGPFGILTPVFWSIVNHAILGEMKLEHYDRDKSLIVSFSKR